MCRRSLRVSINDEAKDFVDGLAVKDNISEPDVVRKALEAYRYLREVRAEDGRVVLARADGTFENLRNV